MGTYVEIFLRPLDGRSADLVREEVAALTGVTFRSAPDICEGQAQVGLIEDDVAIEFWPDSELENDIDMPFESHPHMLEFRAINVPLERAEKSMEKVYEILRATGHYSMFSTFDIQYPIRRDVVE